MLPEIGSLSYPWVGVPFLCSWEHHRQSHISHLAANVTIDRPIHFPSSSSFSHSWSLSCGSLLLLDWYNYVSLSLTSYILVWWRKLRPCNKKSFCLPLKCFCILTFFLLRQSPSLGAKSKPMVWARNLDIALLAVSSFSFISLIYPFLGPIIYRLSLVPLKYWSGDF